METPVLEVRSLAKRYSAGTAGRDIDLSIRPGGFHCEL
jgi:ABC-type phosphonate transport system ATPase subunit